MYGTYKENSLYELYEGTLGELNEGGGMSYCILSCTRCRKKLQSPCCHAESALFRRIYLSSSATRRMDARATVKIHTAFFFQIDSELERYVRIAVAMRFVALCEYYHIFARII